MDNSEKIRQEIDKIKDQIRCAPQGTPHRKIYEMYVKIDELEEQLKESTVNKDVSI